MPGERLAYERAVLSEIRMLLDYVAGCGALDLSTLTVQEAQGVLNAGQVLLRLDAIEAALHENRQLADDDFAFLQLARDAVSRKAKPATGLTVAFTALVAGSRRGRNAESRASLAEQAYPALVHDARKMNFSQYAISIMAVIFTFVAIWVATQVALGKAILNNLDGLRAQQIGISAEKVRLEQALDKANVEPAQKLFTIADGDASKVIPMRAFSLCDRPEAIADYIEHFDPSVRIPAHAPGRDAKPGDPPDRLKLYTSPEERDVCERDRLLAFSFGIVHQELQQYRQDWAGMVGGVFDWPSDVRERSASAATWIGGFWSKAEASMQQAGPQGAEQQNERQDVEFSVAPLLLVWGNYVLPIIFGFLGALMFVILDLYGKLKESRLDPRDNALSWLRLVLGLATGACIGLFVSSYGPSPNPTAAVTASGTASNLVSSLTLSASGLAFLAGFGVEGVFRMLQGLVSRVFVSDTGQPGRN